MEPSRDGRKTICLDLGEKAEYTKLVADAERFRARLDQLHAERPELFPKEFSKGYTLHGTYPCTKAGVVIRRIHVTASGDAFQIRPSFLMPYAVATTDEIEKGLYLRRWGVSFEGIAYVLGRNETFWYRAFLALGRPSLVGTLVKDPDRLPADLVADEKHTWIGGTKAYVAVTAAKGAILGAELVRSVEASTLEEGYKVFVDEARDVAKDYRPESICIDGFDSTRKAWESLCPRVRLVLCFLHSVLKMILNCPRDPALRSLLVDKLWNVYQAPTRSGFSQRLRRLREWGQTKLAEGRAQQTLLKICAKGPNFVVAYASETAVRTTNGVDRVMDYLDRVLYSMKYFHGTQASGRLAVRATAMLWNFHPYGERTRRSDPSRRSPFHDLNGFEYHTSWLQNFLIASSMAGRRL